jgi:hypothetical protein
MKALKKDLPFRFDTFMRSVEFEYLKPVNLWTGVNHHAFIFMDVPGHVRVEVYDHSGEWGIIKSFVAPIPTTLREADKLHASSFPFYYSSDYWEDEDCDPEGEFKEIERNYRKEYRFEEKRRKQREKESKGK